MSLRVPFVLIIDKAENQHFNVNINCHQSNQMKVYLNRHILLKNAKIGTFWIFIVEDGNYEQKKNIANQPRQKKNSNVGELLKGQQD